MKTLKHFFSISILLLLTQVLIAQNHYTNLAMFNENTFNPAHVAFEKEKTLGFSYRNLVSWEPDFYNLSLNYQQRLKGSNTGIGINYYFNKRNISFKNQMGFPINFSIKTSPNSSLRLGIQPALIFKTRVRTRTFYDGSSTPTIAKEYTTFVQGDFDTGLLFEIKGVQLGISVNNITQTKKFNDLDFLGSNTRRVNLHGKIEVPLGDNFTTVPSFYAYFEHNSWSLKVSHHVVYKEAFIGGVTFKNLVNIYAWEAFGGFILNKRFSFFFEFNIKTNGWANNYETVLKYNL